MKRKRAVVRKPPSKGTDKILKNVLKRITPSPAEEREITSLIGIVTEATKKQIGKLSYTLAGSFTRGTWMKDKKEFDMFILFPEYVKRATLEKKGLELGKKIVSSLKGTWKIAYAEHPYTRAFIQGFAVDIVPCYKVSDPSHIKSAVDRTPFHNQYLAKTFLPGLAGEARLLKQFLKANELYGSDMKTQGWSGYLCELLILHYKSFKNLVKEAAEWEPGEFIDLKGHHPIKPPFPGQPLIVIDPVDPKRNVAAVISPKNYVKFVDLCKGFLKNPREGHFLKTKGKPDTKKLRHLMQSRGTLFLGIEFRKPDILDDILYPQMRKTVNRLRALLSEGEFVVLGSEVGCYGKNCILLLEMEVWTLPFVRKMVGPPVFVKKHSKEFLEKYRNERLWVEGENWIVEVRRRYPLAEDLLKRELKQSAAKLREMGVASYIAQSLSKGFVILKGADLIQKKSTEFYSFLQDYLKREMHHY